MSDRIAWILMFSVRGAIYALPFVFGSLAIATGFFLPSEPATGSFALIIELIRNYINLLGLGLALAGVVVWLITWIDDYQNDYLPRWVRNM